MISIKLATLTDVELLAHLGRRTWDESHGDYVEDHNDKINYLNNNFSASKTKQNINDPNQRFYLLYVDKLAVGYAKIVLNASNENITSQNSCQLERIFILNDYIPLKVGQRLLTFVEEQAQLSHFDTIWLTVYIKNKRAIRFYEKNEYKSVGKINFLVNGTPYKNIVYSKEI